MNSIISVGVEKEGWREGEMQSSPMGMPRIPRFRRHLRRRQHAAMAGLGALAEFHLDHFHLRVHGLLRWNFSGAKVPSRLRQPK